MRICPSCGNEVNDNAIVCVKCGIALPEKAEIKSAEVLFPNFIMTLKSGLIIYLTSNIFYLICDVFGGIIFSYTLVYRISFLLEFLEFAGSVLMLVSAFQLGKYLLTKK